jgi:hypothetical protein
MSISIGFKLFKELPVIFSNTFTFNELIIVSTIGSCASFTFLIHIYKISKTNSHEAVIIEVNLFMIKEIILSARKFNFNSIQLYGY